MLVCRTSPIAIRKIANARIAHGCRFALPAGYIDNTPIIDMNYVEECSNSPDLPVAILPHSRDDKMDEEDQQLEAGGSDEDGGGEPTGAEVVMVQMDGRLPLELFDSVGETPPTPPPHTTPPAAAPAQPVPSAPVPSPRLSRRLKTSVLAEDPCYRGAVTAATEGAMQIHALLREEVRQYTLGLAESRGFVSM